MATGIVSIAADLLGFRIIALFLLGLNVVFFVVLSVLFVARLIRFPRDFFADLRDHSRGVGFFTVIAGTCVLGAQFVAVVLVPTVAIGLWIAGVVLYGVLVYTVLFALTVKHEKPTLENGINGGWLIAIVATQSVSVLGTQIAAFIPTLEREIVFFAMSAWLAGGMLYVWVISLIFYRYMFWRMEPRNTTPPYWVDMGAMAISTLAGDLLVQKAGHFSFIARLQPFFEGVTLLFWATATWWLPMLLLLGIWRHLVERYPLRYEPGYWSMVFPLGMYTVCTYKLATVEDLSFLMIVPRTFVYFAFAAWLVTFCGLLHMLGARAVRRAS